MKNLFYACVGYVTLSFDRSMAENVINKLREEKQDSWNYREADGTFLICTTRAGARRLQDDVLAGKAVNVTDKGLPSFFYTCRMRIGVLLGILASALIFLLFSSVLWDVRIEGNVEISDSRIKMELENAGLHIGGFLDSMDYKKIAGDVLRDSADLSFVSIHLDGCVAYVTVRERDMATTPPTLSGCANLVAETDAVIDSLSVSRGEIKVHKGQVVRAGDLLVSGVTEGLAGSHLVYASGEVIGRVQRRFSVVVPEIIEVGEAKEYHTTGISLYFFGKSINIYRNTGNLPAEYVTIYQNDMCYLGDSLRLPFGIVRERAMFSVAAEEKLSADEQVAIAIRRLGEEMSLALGNAEILNKHLYGSFTKDGYLLSCDVECLMNIAVTQEVITDGSEEC